MTNKNPEYDFKWCPGCGDFGVRRAIEWAFKDRAVKTQQSVENNVVVAGIGCSGNLVHLVEGPQPYGIHGIHGRTLPIAFGIKLGRPDLNVVVVAGDGDFLSIGAEHIGPQAQRNLNVTAVIMDNGVYGLTKGQSSPTTSFGTVTNSTPFGKIEGKVKAIEHFLALGVSFVGSGFSGKPRELANLITKAMEHPGFAIVQVQSPCVTYNDTYDYLKGDPKKGIAPALYDVPKNHDASDWDAAFKLARAPGVPIGIIYQAPGSVPMEKRIDEIKAKAKPQSPQELLDAYVIR
ncbi:MAG: 2-oxoacid:ferredoxin oxidoreductase subunit beta [Dehalococcoidia bacterium]|nr:2-oxoacid:ferredoxin oxidoreductase subunit beta [Dehalococcoidia bacterium]